MSPFFVDYANENSYGVKMPRLGTQDGRAALVPLPPLAEQRRIVAAVERALAAVDEIERGRAGLLSAAAAARSKILSLAVSGRLVPQDPADGPASAPPDGCEWETIKSVFAVRSAPKKIATKDYKESGAFPIVDQGQGLIAGWTDDETALMPRGEYIIFGDHTRIVKFVDFPFAQGADGIKILVPSDSRMFAKFLYYAFSSLDVPSRGYSRHWERARALSIPIPPPAEQRRIVEAVESAFAALDGIVGALECRP